MCKDILEKTLAIEKKSVVWMMSFLMWIAVLK
jgi:hypothetical protein